MILSGGGNDQAFLWNAETGETMGSLPRHQDSVISVGFSVDGQWAASGGMDGRVFVASLQTLPITDCITLEGPDEVTVCPKLILSERVTECANSRNLMNTMT